MSIPSLLPTAGTFVVASHAGAGDSTGGTNLWLVLGLVAFVATIIGYALVMKRKRQTAPRRATVHGAHLHAEHASEEIDPGFSFAIEGETRDRLPPPMKEKAKTPGRALGPRVIQAAESVPEVEGVARPRNFDALMRHAMQSESILREQADRRMTGKRVLQSILAQIRDRDILYQKGYKIGRLVHSESLADLAEKLTATDVCGEAQFVKLPNAHLTVRLVGTELAKEAPAVGAAVCFTEAGLLAGALENVEGTPFDVKETRCVVKGDAVCEFRAVRRVKGD